jgi:hypothetical protein
VPRLLIHALSMVLGLGILCLVVFMAIGVSRGELSAIVGGLLSFLGILAVGFGCLFLETTAISGPPSIETHWGGLGGDLGGWRFSESLIYLAASILFTTIFTVAAMNTLPSAVKTGQAASAVPLGARPAGPTVTPSSSPAAGPTATPQQGRSSAGNSSASAYPGKP